MYAHEYGVYFGYLAQDGYWYGDNGVIGKYHRGNDRLTPVGTEILVGDQVIGTTGETGKLSGPHLHTQAGTDQWCQNTVQPYPFEFIGGVVTYAGYGTQWGNFIIIKTILGKYICYAHLDEIYVKIGDKVGGTMPKISRSRLTDTVWRYSARKPHKIEYDNWVGKLTFSQAVDKLKGRDSARKALHYLRNFEDVRDQRDKVMVQNSKLSVELDNAHKQIADLESQLALVSDDTENLNKAQELLMWIIKRMGFKK